MHENLPRVLFPDDKEKPSSDEKPAVASQKRPREESRSVKSDPTKAPDPEEGDTFDKEKFELQINTGFTLPEDGNMITFDPCEWEGSGWGLWVWSPNNDISTFSHSDNSDLHFLIRKDGLGGCGITTDGFASLWASAKATWGVKGGKYFFEVKVESNTPVELEDADEHPHGLRQVLITSV